MKWIRSELTEVGCSILLVVILVLHHIEWNRQPPEAHFKSRSSTSRTNPVISDIMEKLNHHYIDNSDVKFHRSDFPVEFNSGSVTDPDTNPIQLIDDD